MFRAPALPRTLDAALRDVGSSKPSVRADAVRDLVRHAEDARSQVVRALERALSDEAATVRSAAALGLADVGANEALPALLVAIEDDDVHVRQMALTALGEIGDCRAAQRLARALEDARAEVRFQAVIAYARVCKDRASVVEALAARTRDADPLVCHIALRMAEEIGGGEGDPAVDPILVARARALLEHASPTVRVAAAVVLAHSGDRAGAKVLASVVNGSIKTEDAEDEAAAVELAGSLGLEEARVGLERRAFGGAFGLGRDRFAWHARVALASMGHARATREITDELGSWDRNKRTLAVAAVGRARIRSARALVAAMEGDPSRADPHAVSEALLALAEDEPA
ncbi:HEAT repeat domain-containing protein [Polyangium spumosum]|uniref:HEAT repeat domain-containing protein n=1 Tax=Polyangium spumosum TaxID=889282 RepID=A0A6N7PY35_9BACT|nr:HEAT repeat domain-containing protein [Polyangium spumosum]MRG96923.1 HEAT repeat domain-containing protein [Polyangium spumosum]